MGSEVACELDLNTDKFAWVDENMQQAGTPGYFDQTTVSFSQINHR